MEDAEEVEDGDVELEAPAASSGLGVGRAGVTGLGSTGDPDTWPGQSGPSRLKQITSTRKSFPIVNSI